MSIDENTSQPTAATGAQLLITTLPEQHVIHTLVKEHLAFLGKLKQIMEARERLQKCEAVEDAQVILSEINGFVQMLLDADSHHQREEKVLYPLVKELGNDEIRTDMIREHDLLRAMKRKLLHLTSEEVELRNLEIQKSVIATSSERFVANLVAHIQKEDGTLFPLALKVIKDAQTWEKMRIDCDHIGYGPKVTI